jgi:hypothetical protein
MSRKPPDDDGSLELLLDTICNSFGGILFISLSVVLLLNMSSEKTTALPNVETKNSREHGIEQLAKTEARIARLRDAVRIQAALGEQFDDRKLKIKIQTLQACDRQSADLMERKMKNLGKIASTTTTTNEMAEKIVARQQDLKNAEEGLKSIRKQIDSEIASRTRAAKLPKAHRTQKGETAMFVRDGRLCTYSPKHKTEYRESATNSAVQVEPAPGTGIVIDTGKVSDIDKRLDEFDANKHYLAVFVWPDSFEQFGILKERMVLKGFEYRLEPCDKDSRINLGSKQEDVLVH